MARSLLLIAAAAISVGVATAGFVWKPWNSESSLPPQTASGKLQSEAAMPMPLPDEPPVKFAQDKNKPGGLSNMKAIPFDGARCMKYLKELCDIGPRISATDGMKKQQEILIAHFEKHGGKVTKQEFLARQVSRKDKVLMTNLIVSWYPDRPRRVILSTHYDTRPMAHEEQDRRAWKKPFISANDGTSGVAMFMELANHMKDFPTTFGVDFVFFDGEEYIFEPTGPLGGGDKFFFGSDFFGDEYRKNVGKLKYRYEAALLFDLFAHSGASFAVEGYSYEMAPKLVEQIWQVAGSVGATCFKGELGPSVSDDHLALNRAGIPAVDIIDFDGYRPHWHKLSDTPDRCSEKQFTEVAKVVTTWLQLIR